MRAALHLLVLTCLVWCALGIAEPAQAHGDGGRHHAAAGVDHAGDAPGDPAEDGGRGHHHHCPVAPDLPMAPAGTTTIVHRGPLFAARVVALASLTRAPPLPPPSAA